MCLRIVLPVMSLCQRKQWMSMCIRKEEKRTANKIEQTYMWYHYLTGHLFYLHFLSRLLMVVFTLLNGVQISCVWILHCIDLLSQQKRNVDSLFVWACGCEKNSYKSSLFILGHSSLSFPVFVSNWLIMYWKMKERNCWADLPSATVAN